MHGRILATFVCGAAIALSSLPAGAQYQLRMAKFEDSCFGTNHYVIHEAGYPDRVIRFTLGLGQVIHFQLPANSTYSNTCGSWPDHNASWNPVVFE